MVISKKGEGMDTALLCFYMLTNDATNICRMKPLFDQDISTSHKCTFMISRTLIIRDSEVHLVALKQPRVRYLVVDNCTADIQVTPDIPVRLGIVPFELSTSI